MPPGPPAHSQGSGCVSQGQDLGGASRLVAARPLPSAVCKSLPRQRCRLCFWSQLGVLRPGSAPPVTAQADITPHGLKSERFHSNTCCPGSAQGHPRFRRLSFCPICLQIWGSQDPLSDTLTCQNSRNSLEHCADNDSSIIKQMSQEVTSRRDAPGMVWRRGWDWGAGPIAFTA